MAMIFVATGVLLMGVAFFSLRQTAFDGRVVAAFAAPWGVAFFGAAVLPAAIEPSVRVPLIVLASTGLFALGSFVGGARSPWAPVELGSERWVAHYLAVLVLIAGFGLGHELSSRRELFLLALADIFSEAGRFRAMQQAGDFSISAMARVGIACATAASGLSGYLLARKRGTWLIFLTVLVNLAFAVVLAARAGLLLNGLLGFWVWYSTLGWDQFLRTLARRRLAIAVLSLGIVGFVFGIDFVRSGGKISPELAVSRVGVMVGSSPYALDYIIEAGQLGRQGEPQLNWLTGPASLVTRRARVAGLYERGVPVTRELDPNVYSAYRPLVDDFGWPGTAGLLILAGFLATMFPNRVFSHRPTLGIVTSAWFLATISWFPITLPTTYTTWWIALLLMALPFITDQQNLRWEAATDSRSVRLSG